jgi:hypothetical protein
MQQRDKDAMAAWIAGKSVITTSPTGFYVYVATANGIVYYVGKGRTSRYKHCNSGKSSNSELNRLHFAGVKFDVLLAESGLEEVAAFLLETELIEKLKPLFNSDRKNVHIGWTGSKIKNGVSQSCIWCHKRFSYVDTLPGFITTTREIGVCVDCWHSSKD